MKKLSLLASFVSISGLISSPAIAARFSSIYGFGDSLTDTGNINQIVVQATGGTQTFPPSPPYFMGRFSNGPVWIELLAQKLDVPLVNFAFGGATTGFENTLDTTLPGLPLPGGLQQQINNFALNNLIADPNALYAIWAGGNDYLPTNSMVFTPFDNPTQTLNNIEMAINSLVKIGAKNIMVFNLPNLGDIPLNNDSIDGVCPDNNQFDGDCLNDLTLAHNHGLSTLLSGFSSEVNLIRFDINTLVSNNIQNPSPLFTNVTDVCFNLSTFEVCDNPDEFLFWDDRHPTTVGHQLIADSAFQSLAVPESKTIVGLITLGLIGIVKVIKSSRINHE
ncbi:probable lipolytic enzyme, G-D-S-L [Crocosphaera subtropica ATCC 51142]|uniref:Probable lipolytic enzyme, G-D-S-L n=1 Tax=Crocosphaera subtropica (strain ATCC 51142 / BH68) TaxID=43989 RepID=B1WZZ3_CROS5|nr:SGNH/GDSL hydrolase family protein [Crocosphaera subtropica]ACB52892.1 probable lipolytic enzyme, G-D-S-L [Crocosphaera subtropica ATCC 51142]